MELDLKQIAKRIIPLLDLTNLNDFTTKDDIITLCQQAQTPYGNVAAVCVYPQFVKLAKENLKHTAIKIATVANFPSGHHNIEEVAEEINFAIQSGCDEIDIVFPYEVFFENNERLVEEFISDCCKLCEGKTLKVILETGAFTDIEQVYEASLLLIDLGVDFLKTSTGKFKEGATLEASAGILMAIKDSESDAGFKASGGIRTLEDAFGYLALADEVMGEEWVAPKTFRFGASSLLNELLSVL